MVIAVFFVLMPLLFIQHALHKKLFDHIYFNSKYYTEYELGIFSSFPLLFIKTLGYIKAIIFPDKMRRKFKNNILKPKEHPITYALALTTVLILFFSALVISNTGLVAILIYLNK